MDKYKADILAALDRETRWSMDAAARGETAWVCSDCGATVLEGMPDKCVYGHESCTKILLRDKERARRCSTD